MLRCTGLLASRSIASTSTSAVTAPTRRSSERCWFRRGAPATWTSPPLRLGARSRDIARLVLLDSARPIAVGLGAVLASAALTARALSGLLYGVGALDGWSFAAAGAALAGSALLASWLPARRATRVDPVIALRA